MFLSEVRVADLLSSEPSKIFIGPYFIDRFAYQFDCC